MSLLPFLHHVAESRDLSEGEARGAMLAILEGAASAAQIAGFLVALRMKGETAAELVGFARAMREMARSVDAGGDGEPLLDSCGTGGDGLATFNISTVAAFVVAGASVRVAKHGNRSLSSLCGSADLLESLGVNIGIDPHRAAAAIREIGIGFLFAPLYHTAMRHAQPVRQELKMRTVFNLLGPLTNPAPVTVQLVGAPSVATAELIAQALAGLGLDHGFVVHGTDGLDEITTTGPTTAFEIRKGEVERRTLQPEDFGVSRASLADLKGGNAENNCAIAHEILNGVPGPKRDIVVVNAAAALYAAGRAKDFLEGTALARESLDSGAARAKAAALARFTNA